MANRIAEITLPDGRVAEIEGDESNIMEFINSLPDTTQPTQEVARQQTQAGPRKLGIGDVAFGLRPHIMKAIEPKIEQATAGLSQKRMLPELPANTSNLLISPIGKAAYGAAQQTSSPQEFARFLGRTAADPLTYAAGPIIKATAGPVVSAVGKVGDAANAFGRFIWGGAKAVGKGVSGIPKDIGMVSRSRQIEEALPTLRKEIGIAKESSKVAQKELASELSKENIRLGKQYQEAIRTGGREIQEKTVQNLRSVSPKYGAKLQDEISKATGDLKVEDAIRVAQSTLDELASRGIKNTEVEEALFSWIDDLKSTKTSSVLDQFGRPVTTKLREETSTIPIQELLNRRTGVMSKLSAGGAGRGQYSQADLAAITFDKNMADTLSPYLPGLKAIRGEYAQFKKLATELYKVVKPKSGEYNTKAIEGVIKRVTSGKASQGEIDLVKAIEKGTDLLPGAGKFYADADEAAKALIEFQTAKPDRLAALQKEAQIQMANLLRKKELAEFEKRELGRAWTRLKVAGALIGASGTIGTYKALTD